MQTVEVTFPVLGDTLPVMHGYALYSSLARKVPGLHDPTASLSIGPIPGDYIGKGLLRLHRSSKLRCRLPADAIPILLPLAGHATEVAGHRIRLGVPSVQALVPTSALAARLVAMKIHGIPDPSLEQFLAAVRRRLAEREILGEPSVPVVRSGPNAGQPLRRIIRVKDCILTGFALHVSGLSPEDSLRLQAESPFGKRRMGCGFFVPLPREASNGKF